MTDFERELLGVLREALMLNEPPADFTAQSNLFQTFGLDSVDALEIMMVIKRSRGASSVRAPITDGTLQPNPTISGTKDLPGKPSACIRRSMTNAARAI